MPKPDRSELEARRQAAVPLGISAKYGLYVDRAEGAELWDIDGRRYVDFAGGIGVLNVGHRHPRVLAAIEAQSARFLHTCFHVGSYEGYIELAERLNALVPGPGPFKTMLFSTGAEANENAVKIARAFTGRPAVVAFSGGFHGRTLMTLTMTGKARPNKVGFGPLPPEVYHLPYPSAFHGVTEEATKAAIAELFRVAVAPEQIAAIIIEPVQGDGGFNIAPPAFLRYLRELCDAHGILLIADEIQSGTARTGRMFAIEHSGIHADIVTLAKSLGGGMPISAVVARADVADCVPPGGLGSTYGGNPVACAAALAVLDVIEGEGLCARSRVIGERLFTHFKALEARYPHWPIGQVRALGGMVAIEFSEDRDPHRPATELTAALVKEAFARGLLLLSAGAHGNVIRILVPLTASDDLISQGLEIFDASLAMVTASRETKPALDQAS